MKVNLRIKTDIYHSTGKFAETYGAYDPQGIKIIKQIGKFFWIFVAFSEYMNLNRNFRAHLLDQRTKVSIIKKA